MIFKKNNFQQTEGAVGMLKFVVTCVVSLCLIQASYCYVSFQPEQIHLSYGDNLWELVVTWSTMDPTNASIVEYGIGGLVKRDTGGFTIITNDGPEKRKQYIHKVKLTELTPESKYVYHCGSEQGWSAEFWFVTPPTDPEWSPQVAMFGDLGNENAQSMPRLQKETQRGMYDAIIHVGDFAYDLNLEDGHVGDEFMNQIQSVAAYVPYMTCPGNHEEASNFSEYRGRFNMPGDTGALMYSFNMGPIHFISISTEVYYFLQYGLKELVKQYDWLLNDLKEATSPRNRSVHPWIIVFGHRPMYCSDTDHDDCTQHETLVRVGLPFLHFFGLEKLFYDFGVDLEIWAHEHSYERMWPIYDYKIYNGSYDEPYRNPGAPVHIITGSAGCRENTDDFIKPSPPWSAFRSSDYGYMRLKAINRTHLYMEQVSDDKEGEVIDQVWLIKDHHGPYAPLQSQYPS